MNDQTPHPPKWVFFLLKIFIRPQYYEEIIGDLIETWDEYLQQYPVGKARRLFYREIVRLLRPKLVKKWSGSIRLSQYGIWRNYFITAARSLKRNALFSGINIIGLGVSIGITIVILFMLTEIYSFDSFHKNSDRVYRVTSTLRTPEGDKTYATNSIYMGSRLEESIPGIDKVVTVVSNLDAEIKMDDNTIPVTGHFASAHFFDLFSFEFMYGDPQTALTEPGSIVLTASTAKKLFGDESPIGHPVEVENYYFKKGTITGVIKDPPYNSHLQFEALVSIQTLWNHVTDMDQSFMTDKENIWNNQVYILLHDQANTDAITNTIHTINETDNLSRNQQIFNELQPLSDIVPSPSYYNQFGPTFDLNKVWILIILVILVILSACFNYTNLSIARALRRSKEVGIRKITGATRLHVFFQFISESILLTSLSFLIGIGIFFLVKPFFLSFQNDSWWTLYKLDFNYALIPYLLLVIIGIGLLAGIIPAIFMSGIKSNLVLRDATKIRVFSKFSYRQLLLFFQFVTSMGFILFAVTVHKQYQFAIQYDLGYKTDHILNINIQGDYLDILKQEFMKVPEVKQMGGSTVILGSSWSNWEMFLFNDRTDSLFSAVNAVDAGYLSLHHFDLAAGHPFHTDFTSGEPDQVIINQTLRKKLNFSSDEEAIGTSLWYENKRLKIVGVSLDFVNSSLWDETDPFLFMEARSDDFDILGVEISGNDPIQTFIKLEEIYSMIDPLHPFDAEFYDEKIGRTYEEYRTMYRLITFLAMLSVSIAVLGMLGMIVFALESRMKEMSIRKVVGARFRNLFMVLAKPFVLLMIISGLASILLTRHILQRYVLDEFVYQVPIYWYELLYGFMTVFILGITIISWQVRHASSQNPADILRNE